MPGFFMGLMKVSPRVHPREKVGCQEVIAGKPAPTKASYIRESRLAGRPSSPASRLLQKQIGAHPLFTTHQVER